MTTEFTSYYDMAQSFAKLIGSGDVMTGTLLRHRGHTLARILDDRHAQVTTEKNLPTPTSALRGVVEHVLKRNGVIVINKDLSKELK